MRGAILYGPRDVRFEERDAPTIISGTRPAPPTGISPKQADSMKIRPRIEDTVITATLIDSKTTQDFISRLPLTLTMNDLFRREKFARLPRAISKEGKWTHMYEVGEVTYWSAGHAWWRYTLPDRPRRIDVDATRGIFESG